MAYDSANDQPVRDSGLRVARRKMFRVAAAILGVSLASPSLLAEARYATAPPAANAVETVSWSAAVSYTYDGAGNIRQIGNDRFVYDRVGRLVQAEINGVNRTYEYDAFGNRKICTHAPETAIESNCQYGIGIDSSSNRVEDVEYDGAGNVEIFSGDVYSYDAVNMPTRDDRGGGLAKEFIYTANDERIATYTVGSTWNWTIRDVSGKVLREFISRDGSAGPGTGSWSWTRDNVFRDGLLLATRHVANGTPVTHHYHLDHLGTPRRVTDQNDRTVGFHDYYAFGPEASGGVTEPAASSLQYTGHERDKWGGAEGLDTLDYMHARYYSPVMGRFLSVDPVLGDPGEPQSWNRYTYVANNPLRYIDPDGRFMSLFYMGRALEATDRYIKSEAHLPENTNLPNWLKWSVLLNFGAGPAPVGPTPQISTGGVGFIKQHEGFFKNLYLDTGGHCTIGYGHLVNLGPCGASAANGFAGGITEEQGEALLAADIAKDTRPAFKLVTTMLAQGQVDAIAALSFNIGPTAFGRSSILTGLNDNNFGQATVSWLKYNRSGGKYTRGLYNRRLAELAIFWGQ